MNRLFFLACGLILAALLSTSCRRGRANEVLVHTSLGDIRVRLFDDTPAHRDNFLRLTDAGFFDSLLFHRIVRDVAVQGGNPATRPAARDTASGPGYTVPAEISHLPLRGALCAVRGPSVGQSHGSQFFLVPGFSFTQASMSDFEKKAGRTLPAGSRRQYLEHGGVPWLEGQVTVFGQVIEGLEVVDRIAALPRDEAGKPLRDVYFRIERSR